MKGNFKREINNFPCSSQIRMPHLPKQLFDADLSLQNFRFRYLHYAADNNGGRWRTRLYRHHQYRSVSIQCRTRMCARRTKCWTLLFMTRGWLLSQSIAVNVDDFFKAVQQLLVFAVKWKNINNFFLNFYFSPFIPFEFELIRALLSERKSKWEVLIMVEEIQIRKGYAKLIDCKCIAALE